MTVRRLQFAGADGTTGMVELDIPSDGSRARYEARMQGPALGDGVIVVRDDDVRPPAGRLLEIRADSLWAELVCETPGEHWGFGLEGVGLGDTDTVSRQRLMGDTFNFLAKNIMPKLVVQQAPNGRALSVDLGAHAAPVRFVRSEAVLADGTVVSRDYATPLAAGAITIPAAGPVQLPSGRVAQEVVEIRLIPEAGTAAPVIVTVK